MLKITATIGEGYQKLVLEGKLTDPWLSELERAWDEMRTPQGAKAVVVDLKDVTVISERGERLLKQMMVDGAKFNCCRGIFTRHVIQRLVRWCRAQSREGK